jgi:Fic family protein
LLILAANGIEQTMNLHFPELSDLAAKWQAVQPLRGEQDDRLWRKLRLEWTFHSNHIEGNTLTYGETELLLLHDRTSGSHTHREYLEMKAHSVAIEHVRHLATDRSRPLTEADIRDLNRIILKEPYWTAASTPDGQPTRKEIHPGEYKTTPNSVRTVTGEMFYYASVEDTPPKMQALVKWVQQELELPTQHPVVTAARLHYDFVRIHPFDDGNGRVARLLMNYMMLRSGYLPIVVPTQDKPAYLTVLQTADAGDLEPLIRYFAKLAEVSFNLGLRAAAGQSIEEPSDIDKEVAMFVKGQQAHVDQLRTSALVRKVIDNGLVAFLRILEQKLAQLAPLFESWSISTSQLGFEIDLQSHHSEGLRRMSDPQWWDQEFSVFYKFSRYNGVALEPFDLQCSVGIAFQREHYQIRYEQQEPFKKSYADILTESELNLIASAMLKQAFEKLKMLAAGDDERILLLQKQAFEKLPRLPSKKDD